ISSESDKDSQVENSSENTPFASPQLGNPENYPLRPQLLKTLALYILKDHPETLASGVEILKPIKSHAQYSLTIKLQSTSLLSSPSMSVDGSSKLPSQLPPATRDNHLDYVKLILPTSTPTEDVDFIPLYNKISPAEAQNDRTSRDVIKSYYDFGGLSPRYKSHKKTNRKRPSLILVNNEVRLEIKAKCEKSGPDPKSIHTRFDQILATPLPYFPTQHQDSPNHSIVMVPFFNLLVYTSVAFGGNEV
ncbi:9657_t:CDS:2, partial [Ambispora gerdemannii]